MLLILGIVLGPCDRTYDTHQMNGAVVVVVEKHSETQEVCGPTIVDMSTMDSITHNKMDVPSFINGVGKSGGNQ